LGFCEQSDLLSSVGTLTIQVWNVRTGQQLYRLPFREECFALAFYDNLLVVASNKNMLHSWDLDDGAAEQAKTPWRCDTADHSSSPLLSRKPKAVSISVAHGIMAVADEGDPITIWDLEPDAYYYGSCGKKLPSGDTPTYSSVADLLFNPNLDLMLLAVSYDDGDLVVIDPLADQELATQTVNYGSHALAASPDGRLLSVGTLDSIIRIFEFDTLELLYKLDSSTSGWDALAFSPDSTTLAQLLGSRCNIWMPPVLLAGPSLDGSLDGSLCTDIRLATEEEYPSPAGTKVRITAMTLMPDGGGILCGKSDGEVSVYDSSSGDETHTLYRHQRMVNALHWLPLTRTVLSFCQDRIQAWTLKASTPPKGPTRWMASACLFDAQLEADPESIENVLPGEGAGKLIASTTWLDHLWNLSDGREEHVRPYEAEDGPPERRWLQHPSSQSHAIRVGFHALHIHRWHDLSLVVSVSLGEHYLTDLRFAAASPYATLSSVLLVLSETPRWRGGNFKAMYVVGCGDLPRGEVESALVTTELPLSCRGGDGEENEPATTTSATASSSTNQHQQQQAGPATQTALWLTRLRSSIAGKVTRFIGVWPRPASPVRLVYIDAHSWVCSFDLVVNGGVVNLENITSYTRHFFVPQDWFVKMNLPLSGVTEQGNVVLVLGHDLVVIKGGLEYGEIVNF
jgi:WD40 repeat protein